MKRVESTMSTMLIGLLVFVVLCSFTSKGHSPLEGWIPYFPDTSAVKLDYWKENGLSYIGVSIYFPSTGYNITDWGTPITAGNNISANAEVWDWTGIDLPMVIERYHNYCLGDLTTGEYLFTFKTWNLPVKNIRFAVYVIVPDDYPTIQEAINNANDGDTIYVRNGTYYEHVIVNKTVSLIGESRETTVIDGNGTETVVLLNVSNVVFNNFTVRNGNNWGVFVYYADGNSILNNIIFNNSGGIGLHVSKNNRIENNIINQGFSLRSSTDNQIRKNIIINSHLGLYIARSGNNTFRENNLSNNTYNLAFDFGSGVNLQDFVQDMDTSNMINGKPIYYLVNEHNVTIPSDAGYVGLVNCTNIKVMDINISNNGEGLLAVSLTESIISNVVFNHNHHGIVLQDSNDNFVIKNHIEFNGWGVILHRSSDNVFFHNNFIFNTLQIGKFESINTWDNGCEGNYWSNYNGTDTSTPPDGIGDTYVPWEGVDNYPLMSPWTPTPPVITATVDIHPQTLNLRSRGKWITAFIELPEGYDVSDINVSTIMLNDTILAELKPMAVGDYDNDDIPDLMVKFDRAEVTSYILANVNMTKLYEERFMTITLTITGYLNDGTLFQGSDTIRIMMPVPRGAGRHSLLK